MAKSYKTIAEPSEGFYKEKGSKFLAHAYPVLSVDSIKERVDQLKKKYHDARHHCFAFILGLDNPQIRANDDGEPNHSAGDPILGQIRSFELVDVLVVVVRYFGGTKLGVGGLIHAYKSAAEDALAHAKIKTIQIKTQFNLSFKYEQTSELMRILNDFQVEIINQSFTDICELEGKVEPEIYDQLKGKLAILKIDI
ncbi:MAG: YigZ family protein [Reichenbachiella sp.]